MTLSQLPTLSFSSLSQLAPVFVLHLAFSLGNIFEKNLETFPFLLLINELMVSLLGLSKPFIRNSHIFSCTPNILKDLEQRFCWQLFVWIWFNAPLSSV